MTNTFAEIIETDVVVIGSGIGGAMAAYKLASRGKKVVILEQGVRLSAAQVKQVFESESFIGNPAVPLVEVHYDGKKTKKNLPKVVGGLARFYAGVSLRMREKEFERWPFSYNEIEPYYSEAETLMKISGIAGIDPCEPPRSRSYIHSLPAMSQMSAYLSNAAKERGLKPFQHPMAIRFEDGCVRCNHCNQVPCAYEVKWNPDSFLAEQKTLSIFLYDQTEVTALRWTQEGSERKVEAVEALRSDGQKILVKGKNYVLAAGALLTPKLLMKSGLQEINPLIGTHLMTHCLGLVVGFFPRPISREFDFHKWFSVSDYYYDEMGKVRGLIQQDHLTAKKKVFAKIPRWLHPLVARFYYNTCQLLVIAEDEPCVDNRLEISSGSLKIHHTFSKNDSRRRKFLVSKAKKIMRKAGALFSFDFKGESIFHSCGTCRMGDSPKISVTNSCGQMWGVDNLYITDASLFPTSSGVNPSLTIAANSLRVAHLMP